VIVGAGLLFRAVKVGRVRDHDPSPSAPFGLTGREGS
jgi:hypothetical protein